MSCETVLVLAFAVAMAVYAVAFVWASDPGDDRDDDRRDDDRRDDDRRDDGGSWYGRPPFRV